MRSRRVQTLLCFLRRRRVRGVGARTGGSGGSGWFRFLPLTTLLAGSLVAAEPRIDRIERFLTEQVLLHFDTEARRTYELQFLDRSGGSTNTTGLGAPGQTAGSWSNLFVAPRSEFPNHFIVVDYRTNGARFYRLRVTP